MFKTKIRKPGVVFVVNRPKIYRDVAGVKGCLIAQEIARHNTGKLDMSRSATSRTISLVILVSMLYVHFYSHISPMSTLFDGF